MELFIRRWQQVPGNDSSLMLFHSNTYSIYNMILNVLGIRIQCEAFDPNEMERYCRYDRVYLDPAVDQSPVHMRLLIRNGVSVVPVDLERKSELLKHYYIHYFQAKGIDPSQPFLQIAEWIIHNPFLHSDDYSKAAMFDFGDIVLPYFFEDISMIREGPYEWMNVGIAEGDVVFDCGANIGLFSTMCLSRKGRVYAFEPSPAAQHWLKKNLSLYDGQYLIVQGALSDYNGTGTLYTSSKNNEANSLFKTAWHDESVQTEILTLDSFVSQQKPQTVSFIKMDVEGAEQQILRGAADVLRKFRPQMSICSYHNVNDPTEIPALIRQIEPQYIIVNQYEKIYCSAGEIR